MLMQMIVVFKDSSDVEVNNISEQYWTMLIRWAKKRQRDLEMEDTMIEDAFAALGSCIDTLPALLETHAGLNIQPFSQVHLSYECF